MIRDIPWPKDIVIATVRRGAKEEITRGDTIMRPGDILIVVCDEGLVGERFEMMTQLTKALPFS